MSDSLITHGALRESSLSYHVGTHDRKGREGKGREIGGESDVVRMHSHLPSEADSMQGLRP
jgi:hypothetical protein